MKWLILFFVSLVFKASTNPIINEKTLLLIQNQTLWKAEKLQNNFFKLYNQDDARKFLGLIAFTNVTQLPKVRTLYSNFTYDRNNFDSREKWKDCIGNIRNQMQCAISPAIAVVDVLSDRLCIKKKGTKRFLLSVQDLVACDFISHLCEGIRSEGMINKMIIKGISDEKCHSLKLYSKTQRQSCTDICQDGMTKAEYVKVKSESVASIKNEDEIKNNILTKGPVYAEMKVYEDFFHYKEGIYSNVTDNLIGLHSVRIIGWGVENGAKYWIAANSWGKTWGMKGYFNIHVDSCEISQHIYGFTREIIFYLNTKYKKMTENKYYLFSSSEFDFFQAIFEERRNFKDKTLLFGDFKDIVMNYRNFNRTLTNDVLEVIKLDLKERQLNRIESDLTMSERDYFKYLNDIVLEHNRFHNSKDPEFKSLFDMLSNGELTFPRKVLIDVILSFELPVKCEEFFAPIAKKDNISFNDFCLLFKSSQNEDQFLKSFATGFELTTDCIIPSEAGFPISRLSLK